MFYQVQYLPRGSKVWTNHKEPNLTLQKARDEAYEFKVSCPFWVCRIVQCRVVED